MSGTCSSSSSHTVYSKNPGKKAIKEESLESIINLDQLELPDSMYVQSLGFLDDNDIGVLPEPGLKS